MEAKLLQNVQPCSWLNTDKLMVKSGGFVRVPHSNMERRGTNMFVGLRINDRRTVSHCLRASKVCSSLKESTGSVMEVGNLPVSLDESLVLKDKSIQIEPYLNGRCVYLVGMMGSGKTTIGKLLAKAIGYSFFDCDSLVEEEEKMSVAEIFKHHGEGFFRNKETEVLQKISMMNNIVISTGGGAVIRPINWKHMRSGISVWLDVPLDCLARRISAVGTSSRPLLDVESGDAYTKAYKRLTKLFEERHRAYTNANARVSLEYIAAKHGYDGVDNIPPIAITLEVLEQIERFLKEDDFAN